MNNTVSIFIITIPETKNKIMYFSVYIKIKNASILLIFLFKMFNMYNMYIICINV